MMEQTNGAAAHDENRNPSWMASVERWMTASVQTLKPTDTLAAARALLARHRVNQLPVVVNGRLVGLVTEGDLRDADHVAEIERRAPADERTPVEALMTTNILALRPRHTILDAVRLMRRGRFGAIPIIEKGRLMGILTRGDVLDALISIAGCGGAAR